MLRVAGEICGLHAQVLSSAELSLWARVEALPRDAIRRALWEERSLVKTWAMRGTLHLLPASEYPLWQAALSLFRHYLQPGWLAYYGDQVRFALRPHQLQAMALDPPERFTAAIDSRLLLRWQEGETADVVDFLNRKLDMLPFADLTRQISEAMKSHKDDGLARRLIDGRGVLLNRGMNLMQALDGIFSLPEEQLISEVQLACAQYGHHPSQIERQLKEIDSQLYAYLPSRILAQRNIEVMNKMGVRVMSKPSDQPGERSWRVLEPTIPPGPFAEYVVEGYVELTSPNHNNITGLRFVDFPERSDTGTM